MVFGMRSLSFAAAAAIALLAPPAPAQEAKSPAAQAKELYDQGIDLTVQKKLPEAEAKFLQAWALQKSYDVAANLGELAMQLGKPVDAAFFLRFALNNYPASGKQDKREWLERRVKDAKAKIFTLTLTVNVPGAEVRIDGKVIGKAPIEEEQLLSAGEHTVDVTAFEYKAWSKKLPAPAGGAQKLKVDLVLPEKSLIPGLSAAGAGLAALAAGVALYVVSSDKYEEARKLHDAIKNDPVNPRHCAGPSANPQCEALKSAAETSDALYTPGVALLIGGAVLSTVGGAYLGYALSSPSAPATAQSGPRITAAGVRGAGFFVQGTF
jgi:hypothetical protein